jgi:hypothetical protein
MSHRVAGDQFQPEGGELDLQVMTQEREKHDQGGSDKRQVSK